MTSTVYKDDIARFAASARSLGAMARRYRLSGCTSDERVALQMAREALRGMRAALEECVK